MALMIRGAGTLASMSAWGALNLVSKHCKDKETDFLPALKLKCPPCGWMKFHRKFLSIKLMLSMSFLQQTAVFVVGTIMGQPKMTTSLAAQCLTCYEAPVLAAIIWHVWSK